MPRKIIRGLFVEDQPILFEDIAANLRHALRDACELDVTFQLVESVEEAKELLFKGQPDYGIVVTDMLFKAIGAVGLAARGVEVIHQAKLTDNVLVVAISQGDPAFEDLEGDSLAAGADIFRFKPDITHGSRGGNTGWEDFARDICRLLDRSETPIRIRPGPIATGHGPSKRLMMVYGRRAQLVKDLFSLLRALGLEPLEWNALVSETIERTGCGGSPDTLSIVRTGFEIAHGCVVLFSPDDEARVRSELGAEDDTELRGQPRQNVLLEAGYALGCDMEHTLVVSVGRLRTISDLSGLHILRLSNRPEDRKSFAQRLQAMGFDVNTKGDDWLTLGDFSLKT